MSKKEIIKIAICGSATNNLPKNFLKKAKEIGKALAKNKVTVFSGATTGYSYEVAKSAMFAGALTIGISPAENLDEHVKNYKLPTGAYKIIIFTGLGYKARDVVMVRSVDAVIFIGGGTGTLCELCIAIDNKKTIGVLKNSGGATLLFNKIAKISHRFKPKFIYENEAELLVKKVIDSVQKKN